MANTVSKHSRAQIFHALLQLLIWHIPQTAQCVTSPRASHITHEPVVVLLTTRGVHRCLGRTGLHNRATEEPLAIAMVSDNLTTDADTAGALSPSGFDNRE